MWCWTPATTRGCWRRRQPRLTGWATRPRWPGPAGGTAARPRPGRVPGEERAWPAGDRRRHGRPTGAVQVFSGGTSLGQGVETVLAQIAADALGIDLAAVSVICGDTERQPFGGGSWASRSTVVGGNAVHAAPARSVSGRARSPRGCSKPRRTDLVSEDGMISVRGDPAHRVTWARSPGPRRGQRVPAARGAGRAVRAAPVRCHAHDLPVRGAHGRGRGGSGYRPGTVLRYLVAYEVGRAVNPMLVEGQLRGGAAQGIGGALLEEFCYDEAASRSRPPSWTTGCRRPPRCRRSTCW